MNKIFVATRLEEDMCEALKMLAKRQDRTVSYMVRKAVKEYVQSEYRTTEKRRAGDG